MKALIDEYKDEIIERYLAGETAVEIAKTLPFHNSHISRRLHKWGVSRGNKSKKRVDYSLQIQQDFLTGQYYCEDLAKKYGLDVHTVYNILDEANIQRQTGIRSNCNVDYFEQIDNPHKAYLLGFITADGAVVNNYLSIEVQSKDKGLIEFAQAQINPKATITPIHYSTLYVAPDGKKYTKTKDNLRIAFSAKKIGQDLQKYGVVQNKSKTLTCVPTELLPNNLLPFYFRGLIDGDGCVHKDGKVSIYSGSQPFIEDVQKVLTEQAAVSKLSIYQGTSYFVTWSSKADKAKLFQYLYQDLNATYYYPRKYERLKNNL